MGIHTGRRPTGVRLPTPPLSTTTQGSSYDVPPPKSGKRLNLLNPMSLLARRRTSQAIPQLRSESLVSKQGSDTYDFQIKGKYVHDFSAPRVKRNVSYESRLRSHEGPQPFQSSQNLEVVSAHAVQDSPASPWSGGNHTPVFTENFDEEQYPAAGPHVRKANDISDLPLPKPPYAERSSRQAPNSSNNPPEKLQLQQNLHGHPPRSNSVEQLPYQVVDEASNKTSEIGISHGESKSKSPASSTKSTKGRPRAFSGASFRDGSPKHMKSTSSRFSFDMIGAAEQERVLEERHRQKALDKQNAKSTDFEEYDEEYDYDPMIDGDDLEETIPGVNADLEEDDFNEEIYEEEIPGVNVDLDDDFNNEVYEEEVAEVNADGVVESGALPNNTPGFSGFVFQQAVVSPLSPYSQDMVSTPRDANGEVIGFAVSKEAAEAVNTDDVPSLAPLPFDSFGTDSLGIDQSLQGLGLQGVVFPSAGSVQAEKLRTNEESSSKPVEIDDDLYFDDGIIGEQDVDDAVEFDESVFDNIDTDQYGRPIRSLSSLPTLYSPPQITADPSPSFHKTMESVSAGNDLNSETRIEGLAPQPSVVIHTNTIESVQSLTHDSLAAYQSALAAAANRAAAEGKFRRESTSTFNQAPEPVDDTPKVQPGMTNFVNNPNQEPFSSSYDLEDDFNYDDLMEDDAIIAAANAEALANDFDGFYGQEFNFYSAPGVKEAEYVNGGYFGARGMDGLGRSKSGRIVSQEPNLTPITERSESSNRNSVMGFSMNRPDVVSPGLAQLASMLREDYSEGDLSLDALMKLRRGAWGGSQASLHSSNAGSPRSPAPFDESNLPGTQHWSSASQAKQPLHLRRNSGFNGGNIVASSFTTSNAKPGSSGMEIGPPSEPSSMPPSPIYVRSSSALGMDYGPQSPRSPRSPRSPGLPSPSFSSSLSRRGSVDGYGRDDHKGSFRKHRYTGSADSISYVKEEDPINGERWILERRRTADSGEVEIGREVVSGGRI